MEIGSKISFSNNAKSWEFTVNLKAYWHYSEEPALGPPDVITWEDGTPATLVDYCAKLDDTYRLTVDSKGRTVRHIFPDIVAEVYYDGAGKTWALRGKGVEAGPIDVQDPEATDLELTIATQSLASVYRLRILRSSY